MTSRAVCTVLLVAYLVLAASLGIAAHRNGTSMYDVLALLGCGYVFGYDARGMVER